MSNIEHLRNIQIWRKIPAAIYFFGTIFLEKLAQTWEANALSRSDFVSFLHFIKRSANERTSGT